MTSLTSPSCVSLAVKCDSKNAALWWKRCELLERVGNKKQALHGYQVILRLLSPNDGEKYIQLARDLTKVIINKLSRISLR